MKGSTKIRIVRQGFRCFSTSVTPSVPTSPLVRGPRYVEDLRSANGTVLNGRRILSARLVKKHDKIQIGHTIMTVVSA